MLKQRARFVAAGLRLVDMAMLGFAFPIAYFVRDRVQGHVETGGLYPISTYWPLLAASLLFFTPLALLMSASRNSRTLLDRLAFGLGLVVGPIIAAQQIGLDLMWTGLIAGSIAYGVHWVREAGRWT